MVSPSAQPALESLLTSRWGSADCRRSRGNVLLVSRLQPARPSCRDRRIIKAVLHSSTMACPDLHARSVPELNILKHSAHLASAGSALSFWAIFDE